MADLVDRAARTIQSVELNNLSLSEELALAIAQATGVDAGWLLEGNPNTPPRKGLTAQNMATGTGEYTIADYEFHRAFIESPLATPEQMEAVTREAAKHQGKASLVTMSLPIMKAALLTHKKRMLQALDQQATPPRQNRRRQKRRPGPLEGPPPLPNPRAGELGQT
jgi:hypothetical protein